MPTDRNAESDCMQCEPGKHSDTQGAGSADVRASYGAGKYLKTQAMTRKAHDCVDPCVMTRCQRQPMRHDP
jgi:hypothetical protein